MTRASIGLGLSLLLFGLVACGKGTSRTEAPPAAESGAVGEWLRAAAKGQSVVFAATDAGLVAATSAGVLEVLVPAATGEIRDGRYSAADELLFFVRGDRLLVLDLRRAGGEPRPLVQALPEDAAVVIARQGVPSVRIGAPDANLYVRLSWGEPPSVTAGADIEDLVEEDALAAAARATLAPGAAAWLAAEARRTRAKVPPRAESSKLGGALAEAFADCEDCLAAAAFGASGWQVFVAEFDCGDFCHRSCLLYDPGTGQVASPSPTPAWVPVDEMPDAGACVYEFDAAGTSYAAAGSAALCTVGKECRDLGGPVLGFLDPGAPVDP